METQKEYHYTYYSYEEYGRGYIGSRTCKCLPEEDIKYFGSYNDKTFNPTHKIIFREDYSKREEADADEVLLHNYFEVDINPHFANRARQTSSKFRLPKERRKKVCGDAGKIGGKKSKELKKGIFAWTYEERREHALKLKKQKKGMFSLTKEEIIENGKKVGQRTYVLGIGVHGLTLEQRIENGRKGGKISGNKCKELGLGIHSQTREDRVELGKLGGSISSNQKWQCTETGYISNPGGLARYQRKRGIDTTNRIRIQ